MTQRIIVGISGASGAIYGVRLLEALKEAGVETHLVVSKMGQVTLAHETGYTLPQLQKLASKFYSAQDLGAAISSGSFKTAGMVVAPCSMRSLAEIATGVSSSLLTRAADVVLKERRRLVLMVRETPLNAIHLRNMLTVTEAGAIVAPPVPAFYNRPQSLQEVVDHSIARVLDLFEIPQDFIRPWQGLGHGAD